MKKSRQFYLKVNPFYYKFYSKKGGSATMKNLCTLFLLFHFFGMYPAKGAQDEDIDLSLIPVEGILEESDLGKSLNRNFTVGDELVEFRTDSRNVRSNRIFSAASCHFSATQVTENGQVTQGINKEVSTALQSAYRSNCQRAIINVYHAVIDSYSTGHPRGARIRPDLLEDLGNVEVSPRNISDVLSVRQSIGDYYIKTIYNGFIALMRIEFSFDSREDINQMSVVFADNGSEILTPPTQENEGDDDALPAERQQAQRDAAARISSQMARRKINGSWRVTTLTEGTLENGATRFPFVNTEWNALAGNYQTLLNHMTRFNTWVSNLDISTILNSNPVLVDIGRIRDSRSLYLVPIPGLQLEDEDISLSRLEREISRIFTSIIAAKRAFCGTVNSPSRTNKQQSLLRLLEENRTHIEYLVHNAVEIDSNTRSSVLHWAAVYDLPELAEMIIEMDTSRTIIDSRDRFGRTPLMRAAANGSFSVAEMLIGNSAALDDVDDNGNSAFTYATMTSNTGLKQLGCVAVAGAGMVGAPIVGPGVAIGAGAAGTCGELFVNAQRVFKPDNMCDHVFYCGHKSIANLLIRSGADQSLKAGWSGLNTMSNAITGPFRVVHKGIRYVGRLGNVDDDRN